MMTPRERWLALFENRPPDRIVTDYWATGEFSNKLQTALNVTTAEQIWRGSALTVRLRPAPPGS